MTNDSVYTLLDYPTYIPSLDGSVLLTNCSNLPLEDVLKLELSYQCALKLYVNGACSIGTYNPNAINRYNVQLLVTRRCKKCILIKELCYD